MANSSPAGIVIMYDDSGDTPRDITPYVLSVNGIKVKNLTEETRPFGVAWGQNKTIGVGMMDPIVISGLYDDVANGPNALLAGRVPEGPAAATRTFTITWVGAKTTSVETILQDYERAADKNGLTKYTATLIPTGTVTEA